MLALIMIGGVMSLERVTCSQNCLGCSSAGGGTDGKTHFCTSCYKSTHKWTSPVEQSCSGTGISNCLVQTTAWMRDNNSIKEVQVCSVCEPSYGLVYAVETGKKLEDESEYPTTECKLLEKNVAVGKWTKTGTTYTQSATYCKAGYVVLTTGATAGQECTAKGTDDRQGTVANCYAYSNHLCEQCEVGYQLIRTPNGNLYDSKKNNVYEYCLKIPDKYIGCLGSISYNVEQSGCSECNYWSGFYDKEIILDGSHTDSHTKICVGTLEATKDKTPEIETL